MQFLLAGRAVREGSVALARDKRIRAAARPPDSLSYFAGLVRWLWRSHHHAGKKRRIAGVVGVFEQESMRNERHHAVGLDAAVGLKRALDPRSAGTARLLMLQPLLNCVLLLLYTVLWRP